jgi:hypothetical protein
MSAEQWHWLVAGQSLFATAAERTEPLRWLTSVLKRLPTYPNSQLATLAVFICAADEPSKCRILTPAPAQ